MSEPRDAAVLSAETLHAELPRWQLPSFDPGASPPTAQQLDQIEAAAYQEGFQRGQAEGYAAGQRAAATQAQRLQALVEHIARPLAHLDDEIEHALVELAGAIARRILHEELVAAPERVAALVREALAGLPPQLRSVRLCVHPEDAVLLREQLVAPAELKDLEIVADPQLKRGDCRVFTESALVDARLDRRVRVVAQALAGEET
ncbi:MAG: FliH/SctL family protein [Pseudomonadota bacterium]